LKEVNQITYRYAAREHDGAIEVHTGSVTGPLVSTLNYKATGAWSDYQEASAPVTDPGGKNDLYFVFVKNDEPNRNLAMLDWIRFDGGTAVVEKKGAIATKKKAAATETGDAPSTATTRSTNTEKKPAENKSAGSALIAKSDCMTCHRNNERIIGPSYAEVARRYKNKPSAGNMLVNKIINGGAGNWGEIPMTPHPQLSKKDAAEMVKYILSVKPVCYPVRYCP
jgi:cytochrome c